MRGSIRVCAAGAVLLGVAFGVPRGAAGPADADAARHVVIVGALPHGLRGSPLDAAENYTRAEALAALEPENWGGAFVDGEHLVVKYVGIDEGEARKRATRAKLSDSVKLVPSDVSLVQLRGAQQEAERALATVEGVVSIGPSYSHSAIKVRVSGDAGRVVEILHRGVRHSVRVYVLGNESAGGLAASRS